MAFLLLFLSFLAPFAEAKNDEHVYLVEGVISSEAHLRKVGNVPLEAAGWYASIPALIVGHGLAVAATGPEDFPLAVAVMGRDAVKTAAPLIGAGAYATHAVPLVTAKTYGRLWLEAHYKASKQIKTVSSFPGNPVTDIYSLQGVETTQKKLLVDTMKMNSMFFIKTKNPIPPGTAVDVASGEKGTQKVTFKEIPDLDSVQLTFKLAGVKGDIPEWKVSMKELLAGARLPMDKYPLWEKAYEEDKEQKSHVELEVMVDGKPKPVGTFITNVGMEKFLGKTLFARAGYQARKAITGQGEKGAVSPGQNLKLDHDQPNKRRVGRVPSYVEIPDGSEKSEGSTPAN